MRSVRLEMKKIDHVIDEMTRRDASIIVDRSRAGNLAPHQHVSPVKPPKPARTRSTSASPPSFASRTWQWFLVDLSASDCRVSIGWTRYRVAKTPGRPSDVSSLVLASRCCIVTMINGISQHDVITDHTNRATSFSSAISLTY